MYTTLLYVVYFRGWYVDYPDGDINHPDKKEREWGNNDLNFDDVMGAMLTLFTVSTFEGWPQLVLLTILGLNTY